VNRALLTQVGVLARRSVIRTLRQPSQVFPALAFPLFLLAINAGGLDEATNLPGFPTGSYLTFALGFTFVQGAIFATMNAGTDLAGDVESGFLNRLALTPLHGAALLVGLLAGVVVLGLIQAGTYLVVGFVSGADFAAGIGGVAVIVVLSVLITLGFGAVGSTIALRTGNGEAVQGMFPLLFVLLFLSSMSLPRNLIEQEWFRTVATANPVSYLIEGVRSLLVTGWDTEALALGFGFAVAIIVGGLWGASAALKTRLVRT
jgi:ABC-2 type transport system permease protein